MSNISSVVLKRLTSAIPKFKKVLQVAKDRDINEANTVVIITDMLEKVFGFDRYADITREYVIQGTYCDLAVKTGKQVEYLVEVKAIGLTLNKKHIQQAVNYAARGGIKWVVLTNGIHWEIHRVMVDQKINSERLFSFNFLEINVKDKDQQDLLFMLCKRGMKKDLITDYYEYKQSVNPYILGSLLCTDAITNIIRRELRKYKVGLKVEIDELKQMLRAQVIKHEVLDSELGIEAGKLIARFVKKQQKTKKTSTNQSIEATSSAPDKQPQTAPPKDDSIV